jgi:hypothetical protein
MLYYNNGHRRTITGASLAQLRRRMSAPARACFAADVIDGRIVLQGLTIKAVAALAGTSVDYVHHALRLTPEQRASSTRRSSARAAADARASGLRGRRRRADRLGGNR